MKKDKPNGGGSATNSGIDYQNRISAWFLVSHYSDFNISKTIDFEKDILIDSIHFETNDFIDDIKIVSKEITIYCQIKRRIHSLSESKSSDFHKSIKQFITSFINNYSIDNIYVLVTTSESSNKIKKDLRKILTSIRLNDSTFSDNPLNKSEEETLKSFRTQFFHVYQAITGKKTDEIVFNKFCKQVYVSIIDLEDGSTNIGAALMLLRSKGFNNPELIWKLLISNCTTFASKRQSINKDYLVRYLNQYTDFNDQEGLNSKIQPDKPISCGKDVLLIDSFVDNIDYLIVELFRFDDSGIKKLIYSGDRLINENTDLDWKVIFRSATVSGMLRYLDENKEILESKEVAFIGADESIDNVEELPHVIAYKSKYQKEFNQMAQKGNCLHCGMNIGNEKAYMIEIDETGFKNTAGLIHQRCHRKLDRVLGTADIKKTSPFSHLDNFDFLNWIRLLKKGQGQITAIKNYDFGETKPIISYNFERELNDGAFCIRILLSDATYSYLYCGHEIERYDKAEGEKMLEHLNNELKESQKINDPIFVTNTSYNRGNYSYLLKRKKSHESLIKVLGYELIRYSKMLSKINENIENDYTPICLLYEKESQELIQFSNIIPLVSEPLKFDSYFENWSQAGYNIPNCELRIIENDKEFGLYLLKFFEKNQTVIIDPQFDLNKNLIKGFQVVKFQDFIANHHSKPHNSPFHHIKDPRFVKGDNVQVVFPEIKTDKIPEGFLVEDEMENDEGEKYVIFQPSDSELTTESMFAIPSKLIKKK
jgi:hypothetical protein